MLREANRKHTQAGPGRMPFRRTSRPNAHKLTCSTGPGSINCENEVRNMIHAGDREGAIALYEANKRVYFRVGKNPGLPRLKAWYSLAKAGDPRAL